jgi:queuosine precursor transporter
MKTKPISIFFVVIYTITIIASLTLTNKMIEIHGYLISGCLLVFPLLFFFSDIIAEIYGYYLAQKLIWLTVVGAAIFSVIISLTLLIPTPAFYNNNDAYQQVFGMSLKFTAVGFLAIWVGMIINAYFISKWKILLRGRYFWLRSVGSSAIGELANSLIAFPLAFAGVLPVSKIISLTVVSYVIKMAYAIIAATPGVYIVNYIKHVKGIDHHANHIDFNPFAVFAAKKDE